jgi:hypothetical protein
MDRIAEWILYALMLAIAFGISLWMAGAIYYDICREGRWAHLLVVVWAVAVIVLLAAWHPLWQPFAALIVLFALLLRWWLGQKPSNRREWDESVAVLPRAVRDRDSVTIESIRNFDYPSRHAFTPRYQTRTVRLTNLRSLDIIFFKWGPPWMSHPVLVFDFGPDGRVCVSIEVRYRKGQRYSVVRSLYRQQELIFVVADERDIILRRTKHGRNQDTHLYRFNASPDEMRSVFVAYIEAINTLHETPRWYNGLCANCTTSFYRLPGRRFRYDWRVLANGRLDQALYEDGRLDQTLPFNELQRVTYLTDIANDAPEDGFGEHIRHELERRRHER